MNYRGISTETLEESLNVYSERLTDWNTTEGKRKQYITRVDEIASELYRRYEEKNVRARHTREMSTKVNEEVRKCELCGSSNWRILHEGDESNCECEGECLRVCDNPELFDDGCDGIATKEDK